MNLFLGQDVPEIIVTFPHSETLVAKASKARETISPGDPGYEAALQEAQAQWDAGEIVGGKPVEGASLVSEGPPAIERVVWEQPKSKSLQEFAIPVALGLAVFSFLR